MAYAGKRSAPQAARQAPRPAPAPVPRQAVVSYDSGRFERGLERRWENAWNRARQAGGLTR
jgi:hypothetical protein